MDEDEDAYEEGGPDEAAGEAEIDPATLLDRFRSLTGQADPTAGSSEPPAADEEYLGADAVPAPSDQQMMELEAEAAPPRAEQPSEEPIFQVINIDDDDEEPEVSLPTKVTWTSMPKDSFLDARVVMRGETVHVALRACPRHGCRDEKASLRGDQEKAWAVTWLCKQSSEDELHVHPRFLGFELVCFADGSEASPTKKVCSTQQLTFEGVGLLACRTYTFVLYISRYHSLLCPKRRIVRERPRGTRCFCVCFRQNMLSM